MIPIDDIVSPVFMTCANLVVMTCAGTPVVRITNPEAEADLRPGEFPVILNLYKKQALEIDRLTRGMSDEEACSYMRDETNKVLEIAARNGLFRTMSRKGAVGKPIPSVSIDRVKCFHEDSGRRRFVGIGKGTIASL